MREHFYQVAVEIAQDLSAAIYEGLQLVQYSEEIEDVTVYVEATVGSIVFYAFDEHEVFKTESISNFATALAVALS